MKFPGSQKPLYHLPSSSDSFNVPSERAFKIFTRIKGNLCNGALHHHTKGPIWVPLPLPNYIKSLLKIRPCGLFLPRTLQQKPFTDKLQTWRCNLPNSFLVYELSSSYLHVLNPLCLLNWLLTLLRIIYPNSWLNFML